MINQLLTPATGLPEWITRLTMAPSLQNRGDMPSESMSDSDDPISMLKKALIGTATPSIGMNFTKPGGLFGTGGASQLSAPTTGGSNLLTILATLGIK